MTAPTPDPAPPDKHQDAWRVGAKDQPYEYGVLIRIPTKRSAFWWLLCPGAATVYLDDNPSLLGCSDEPCTWDDVHHAADELRRRLTAEVDEGYAPPTQAVEVRQGGE